MLSKEVIDEIRELTDDQVGVVIIKGMMALIRLGDPAAMRVFLADLVNAVRLAEAGRVPVRDEGAN